MYSRSKKWYMKIILIHKWRQEYVKYSLQQLLQYTSVDNIILLTDDVESSRKFYNIPIIFDSIDRYFTIAKEFEKYYIHRSKNTFEFELFCFQRWFILLEYVKAHNISRFLHIDSDVLIVDNLEKITKNSEDFNYVMICGHNLLANIKWLGLYCDYIMEMHQNNSQILDDYKNWVWHEIIPMNNFYILDFTNRDVTDMTLLYLLIKSNPPITYKNIGLIDEENCVCDNNIWYAEWFDSFLWLKKVKYIDGKYYGFIKNKKVQFLTLHFQWVFKKMIPYMQKWQYYRGVFALGYNFLFVRTISVILQKILPQKYYNIIQQFYIKYILKRV